VEVDPDGSTIVKEGGGNEQLDDKPEIRSRQRAHADLRLQEGSPPGEVVQEAILAGPSTREWTPIVTDNDGIGTDVSIADTTEDFFAVAKFDRDFCSNDDECDIAPSGAPKCSTVVLVSRVDGAGGDMKDGLFVTAGVGADDPPLIPADGAEGAVCEEFDTEN
jgi:hypothetical protein